MPKSSNSSIKFGFWNIGGLCTRGMNKAEDSIFLKIFEPYDNLSNKILLFNNLGCEKKMSTEINILSIKLRFVLILINFNFPKNF
jgi:hypothetical protein